LLLDEEVLKMQLAQEQSLSILEGDHQIEAMVQPKKVLYTQEETTVATRK